jgi:hypothetical protein
MRYASGEVLETEWEAGLPADQAEAEAAPTPAAQPDTAEEGPGAGAAEDEAGADTGNDG